MAHLQVGKMYVLDEDFRAESEGELDAAKGSVVTVLEPEDPSNPGWIFVSMGDAQGFVPSDFLQQDQPVSSSLPPPPPATQLPPPPAVGAPPPAMYSSSGSTSNLFGSERFQQQQSYGAPPPALGAPMQASMQASHTMSAYSSSSSAASAYGAPAATPAAYSVQRQPSAGEEERFRAEQRVISLELWQFREELLGPGNLPDAPSRRWFYRDFFGDMQGPFNAPEMRERLNKEYIKDESIVAMEIGTGEFSKYEEEKLKNIFRSPEAAFGESPRLTKIGGSTWFYLGKDGKETGPFSNEQMRAWFDAGYFGGESLVRLANGQSTLTPLKDVYADPANSFKAPPNLPGADLMAFPGHRTAVLVRDPHMKKRPSAEPQTMETDKVQVEFDAPPKEEKAEAISAKSDEAKKKDPNMVLYGANFPKYSGIPSPHNLKQNVYSSMLYTFVTRPLHPEAGTVQMYIRRDIDGSHINFNKYVLFLEETNTPIMAAFRHHHTIHNYFDIKLSTTGKLQDNARGLTIANLELNFIGTTFLLHNNVQGHQGTSRDMCCVTYERNRVSNKGPRKMKVGIPALRDDKPEFVEWKHEGMKNSPMVQALKSIATKDLLPLLNKPPRWNEKKKAYMLDFKGRVTRSSVKNFQLVDAIRDPDHKSVLLQHGRVGVNRFTLDVKHPLSILQGFAIALSSLHSKKGVD